MKENTCAMVELEKKQGNQVNQESPEENSPRKVVKRGRAFDKEKRGRHRRRKGEERNGRQKLSGLQGNKKGKSKAAVSTVLLSGE